MSLWGEYLEELLDVSFNGTSFQAVSGGQITNHNFDEMPAIRSSQNAISSAHRSITAGRFFVTKHSTLKIAVHGEFHELQAILGRFRQLIQYKNKDLVLVRGVPINDSGDYDLSQTTTITFRNSNVIAADLGESETKGFEIVIEFLIDDPIGIGSNSQTLFSVTGRTSSSYSFDYSTIDIQGTFLEQYPLYEITVNSITNGGNPTLSIENGLNKLTISQSLTAGDVILIDTDPENMGVKINDEIVDFSGGIPFLADPQSAVYITDTFSARNLDIEAVIQPRYI